MPCPLAAIAWIPAILALVLPGLLVLVLLRFTPVEDESDGTDPPDGGGGGGGGVRRPESPRRPPPGEPVYWPEFERQFAEYVARRVDRQADGAPPR